MDFEKDDKDLPDCERIELAEIDNITDSVRGNIYNTFGFLPKLEDGDNMF